MFVVTEMALIFWIRDGVLLNLLTLVYSVNEIKGWQAAGH